MTDKLTPAMLRDLADLCNVGNRVVTLTANGETTRFYPNKDLSYVLLEEAARREAEARPQNGRGHIPLITCPGSTKSCMGYDCLDKGCLDGEPKTVHTCNFVDSDQVGVFICHGCGRKLMPKGLSVDALRSANISIGGCEVCTTPTGCEQEKHCDHFNMAFYSEREGPGSAAVRLRVERDDKAGEYRVEHLDKPAPADDDLLAMLEGLAMGLEQQEEKSAAFRVRQAADRIDAQALHIGRLEADLQYTAKGHDDLLAENARLREALEQVVRCVESNNTKTAVAHAQAALARGGDHG